MSAALDIAVLAFGGAYTPYTAIVGPRDYRRFKAAQSTEARQAFLRNQLIEGMLSGAGALFALTLKGRLSAVFALPAEFHGAHMALNQPAMAIAFWSIFAAFVVLLAAPLFVIGRLSNSERDIGRARKLLAAQPLLARNGHELFWGGLLSIDAGLSEELLFRLVLPLSVYALSGNLAVALTVPLVAFGIAHLYQGLGGVIATGVVGALMLGVYIASGSLLVAMAVHALVDLRAIVLLGWMVAMKAAAAPKASA
jgi:membrane protease YdiL (CAAX protease family)